MSRDGVSPTGRSGETPCCDRTRRLLGPRPRLRSGRKESRPLGGGGEVFPAQYAEADSGSQAARTDLGTCSTRLPLPGFRWPCLLEELDLAWCSALTGWVAAAPPDRTTVDYSRAV